MERKKYLKANVIVFKQRKKSSKEEDELARLGISSYEDKEEPIEEIITEYGFNASLLKEYRETFVKFKGQDQPAIVALYGDSFCMETPAMLFTVEQFKKALDEYYQEDSQTY